MIDSIKVSGVLRTAYMVGRTREIESIREAVQANHGLRVLFIVGAGGLGKTRLLEEIPNLLAPENSCINTGIFDLYLPIGQSADSLSRSIVHNLEARFPIFENYHLACAQLDSALAAGAESKRLDVLRHNVQSLFLESMNRIGEQARLVIAFDTTESIQYEDDFIQEICRIEAPGDKVKDWLLATIPQLQNAAVFFAGRDKPALENEFVKIFGQSLTLLRLEPFTEGESLSYFSACAEMIPNLQAVGLALEQQRVIHHYTGGYPLKLAIVIELLIRNLDLPERFFDPLEVAQTRSSSEIAQVREQVESDLVLSIMTSTNLLDQALPYIGLARKGINEDLLQAITGWSAETCSQVLADLSRLSFTKVRTGTNWLFLHDEMYDLLDKYTWSRMESEREEICASIIAYYDKQLEEIKETAERQNLLTECLYYQFLLDPITGYHQYSRLSNHALYGHDLTFDLRLRDEMLRSFTRYPRRFESFGLSPQYLNHDSGVHWVKRFRVLGDYSNVIRIANLVMRSFSARTKNALLQLSKMELVANRALALIYTGNMKDGVAALQSIILEIENKPLDLSVQGGSSLEAFNTWRKNLLLGWAHNNLGYTFRMHQGHYRKALLEFTKALEYFKREEPNEELANTCDNMGRVYALLGDQSNAESLVNYGQEIRIFLKRDFRIALSLNSRAIVYLTFDEPLYALRAGETALRMFEELDAQRGIGLACITFARASRYLGSMRREGLYTNKEIEEYLKSAIVNLERALGIFDEIVREPVRLVETHNELGCVYREIAKMKGAAELGGRDTAHDKAIKHFEKAIDLAREKYPVLYADSCEDLAQVYHDADDVDRANQCLNIAEKSIPEVYKIKMNESLQQIPVSESIEEFWRQLGKNQILRGHLFFRGREHRQTDRASLLAVAEHYALASCYFYRYSEHESGLRKISQAMFDNLKTFPSSDLKFVRDNFLEEIASKYGFHVSPEADFFSNSLNLAIQIVR